MKLSKHSKFVVVDSANTIEDFFEDEEKGTERCNHLNRIYNNRPQFEFGYAMGKHDFKVLPLDGKEQIEKLHFSAPFAIEGAKAGGQLFNTLKEAALYAYSQSQPTQIKILIELKED